MKWRLIDKKNVKPPTKGTYSDWKPQLSKEAAEQCVYCCIPENKFGGMRNFHVEHLRPQSQFPKLTNAYENLFYACGVCNVFKSDDWPGDHVEDDYTKPAYPDPSVVDYGTFLTADPRTGLVTSKSLTGAYVIERLYLNRPHMVGLRILADLLNRIHIAYDEMEAFYQEGKIEAQDKDELIAALFSLRGLMRRLSEVKPYSADQIKRA